MKFGKLHDISKVDFSLPIEPDFNAGVFENLTAGKEKPKVYIGCTGWAVKEWVGSVYPAGTKAKNYLFHYSRQFNTIELNTTHYRIPNEKTVEKWRHESAEDFRFCPKILQSISHSLNLGFGNDQIYIFCDAVADLEEKLGCCFIQLPPYFAWERLAVLEAFLENFPIGIPLAVEVRHESWFHKKEFLEQFLKTLKDHQTAAVITDVAGRRDVLHMGLSTDTTMIRFVGNGLDESDYSRIDEWVGRLEYWFLKGLKTVYFFIHEPENLLAPELSVYLFENLKKHTNAEVRGPKLFNSDGGEQLSLF